MLVRFVAGIFLRIFFFFTDEVVQPVPISEQDVKPVAENENEKQVIFEDKITKGHARISTPLKRCADMNHIVSTDLTLYGYRIILLDNG